MGYCLHWYILWGPYYAVCKNTYITWWSVNMHRNLLVQNVNNCMHSHVILYNVKNHDWTEKAYLCMKYKGQYNSSIKTYVIQCSAFPN